MKKYYLGAKAGNKYWHVLEKGTDKTLAVTYDVSNGKQIITALNKDAWVSLVKRKPKLGGEYLIVWILDDGGYPVTADMDYDCKKDKWTDPRNNNITVPKKKILF